MALSDMQQAADDFYCVLKYILDKFYPVSKITITSRDPPFVTPNIKGLLRKKNTLMRKGRIKEANALSTKIRAATTNANCLTFKG